MSKLFDLVVEISLSISNKDYKSLYYIDKEWYNNWCKYSNLEYVQQIILSYFYDKQQIIKFKDMIEQFEKYYFPKKEYPEPKGPFNKEIKFISKDKIFNDNEEFNELYKNNIPIDESFYEKISDETFELLKKVYHCKNIIKINERICVLIYDKKKKNCEVKYYFPIQNDKEIAFKIIMKASSLSEKYDICYFNKSQKEIKEMENSLIKYIEDNLNNFEKISDELKKEKVLLLILDNKEKTNKNEIKFNNYFFQEGNYEQMENENNKKDNNDNISESIILNNQKNKNEEKNLFDDEDDDYKKYFEEDGEIKKNIIEEKEYNNIIENDMKDEGIRRSISNNSILFKKTSSSSINYSSKTNEINQSNLSGTMGIINLGNNCYMNSVFQCLSNIFPLTDYLISDNYRNEINYNNPSNSNGNIVIAFAELLKIIWNSKIPLTQIEGKSCYYYEPKINENDSIYQKMIDVFSNLKNEIGKNNKLYHNYDQQDAILFFTYFLNIIHEDLKRNNFTDENKNFFDISKEKDINKLFQNKWNIFKQMNNSIITDIFFGMTLTSNLCKNCLKTYHIFEPYDIIHLSLNESDYKADKSDVEESKKKEFIKDNISFLPGKDNFYFCQCIIIPYNLSEKKNIVIYPIKKCYYDFFKIKDIIYMFSYIYNLKDDDLIAGILSDDFNKYKIICSGEEYLYEIFLKPIDIKIFLIEQKDKELKLRKELVEPKKLFDFFLNPQKKINNFLNRKNDTNFIVGEEELNISEHTIDSSKKDKKVNFNENKILFFKVLSFLLNTKTKNLECLSIPKIFKYDVKNSLEKLHSEIKKAFNISEDISYYNFSYFEKFKYNNQNQKNIFNFDIRNLIDDEIENNKRLYFILCIKVQPNTDYNRNYNKNEEYYVPIPYINQSLEDYLKFLNKKFSFDNQYKIKNLIINVIWLHQYEKNIKEIEKNSELNNIYELNPYEEIINEINEKSEKIKVDDLVNSIDFSNEQNELNLTLLLKYYTDYEKYDENNVYHCHFCNKQVIGFKQTLFYSLPDVIIFHFQRKVLGKYNDIKITFPINNDLDLSKFSEDEKTKNKKYELIGIINYEGNNLTGHYNSFCKNPIKHKWYKFNDTACFIVDDIEKEINYQQVYAVVYKNKEFKEYKISD